MVLRSRYFRFRSELFEVSALVKFYPVFEVGNLREVVKGGAGKFISEATLEEDRRFIERLFYDRVERVLFRQVPAEALGFDVDFSVEERAFLCQQLLARRL